jgi:hypothetical protein
MQKRRRKKKRFHNEMDDIEKGYDNDMYVNGRRRRPEGGKWETIKIHRCNMVYVTKPT